MGSPAKVIRQLDESSVEALRLSSKNYVANYKSFREGAKIIG